MTDIGSILASLHLNAQLPRWSVSVAEFLVCSLKCVKYYVFDVFWRREICIRPKVCCVKGVVVRSPLNTPPEVSHSRVFHPCHLVPRFQVVRFPPMLLGAVAGVVVVQIVFGRVQKTASAPTSPSVSRCSTPGPSELDDDEANEDDHEDGDVGEEESEEEREELNKRESTRRDLTKSFRETTLNTTDSLPAHSA